MADLILPDTSVWVDYLRRGDRGRAATLREHLSAHRVVVCGPVLGELLAGARAGAREQLLRTIGALPLAALDRGAWVAIGGAARELRSAGEPLPLTEIAIGVAASRAGATLWTFDRDFERVAAVVEGLELELSG